MIPVHVPPLLKAEDLHSHVWAGSRSAESEPLHAMQNVAFMHSVQLLLQTFILDEIFLIIKIKLY